MENLFTFTPGAARSSLNAKEQVPPTTTTDCTSRPASPLSVGGEPTSPLTKTGPNPDWILFQSHCTSCGSTGLGSTLVDSNTDCTCPQHPRVCRPIILKPYTSLSGSSILTNLPLDSWEVSVVAPNDTIHLSFPLVNDPSATLVVDHQDVTLVLTNLFGPRSQPSPCRGFVAQTKDPIAGSLPAQAVAVGAGLDVLGGAAKLALTLPVRAVLIYGANLLLRAGAPTWFTSIHKAIYTAAWEGRGYGDGASDAYDAVSSVMKGTDALTGVLTEAGYLTEHNETIPFKWFIPTLDPLLSPFLEELDTTGAASAVRSIVECAPSSMLTDDARLAFVNSVSTPYFLGASIAAANGKPRPVAERMYMHFLHNVAVLFPQYSALSLAGQVGYIMARCIRQVAVDGLDAALASLKSSVRTVATHDTARVLVAHAVNFIGNVVADYLDAGVVGRIAVAITAMATPYAYDKIVDLCAAFDGKTLSQRLLDLTTLAGVSAVVAPIAKAAAWVGDVRQYIVETLEKLGIPVSQIAIWTARLVAAMGLLYAVSYQDTTYVTGWALANAYLWKDTAWEYIFGDDKPLEVAGPVECPNGRTYAPRCKLTRVPTRTSSWSSDESGNPEDDDDFTFEMGPRENSSTDTEMTTLAGMAALRRQGQAATELRCRPRGLTLEDVQRAVPPAPDHPPQLPQPETTPRGTAGASAGGTDRFVVNPLPSGFQILPWEDPALMNRGFVPGRPYHPSVYTGPSASAQGALEWVAQHAKTVVGAAMTATLCMKHSEQFQSVLIAAQATDAIGKLCRGATSVVDFLKWVVDEVGYAILGYHPTDPTYTKKVALLQAFMDLPLNGDASNPEFAAAVVALHESVPSASYHARRTLPPALVGAVAAKIRSAGWVTLSTNCAQTVNTAKVRAPPFFILVPGPSGKGKTTFVNNLWQRIIPPHTKRAFAPSDVFYMQNNSEYFEGWRARNPQVGIMYDELFTVVADDACTTASGLLRWLSPAPCALNMAFGEKGFTYLTDATKYFIATTNHTHMPAGGVGMVDNEAFYNRVNCMVFPDHRVPWDSLTVTFCGVHTTAFFARLREIQVAKGEDPSNYAVDARQLDMWNTIKGKRGCVYRVPAETFAAYVVFAQKLVKEGVNAAHDAGPRPGGVMKDFGFETYVPEHPLVPRTLRDSLSLVRSVPKSAVDALTIAASVAATYGIIRGAIGAYHLLASSDMFASVISRLKKSTPRSVGAMGRPRVVAEGGAVEQTIAARMPTMNWVTLHLRADNGAESTLGMWVQFIHPYAFYAPNHCFKGYTVTGVVVRTTLHAPRSNVRKTFVVANMDLRVIVLDNAGAPTAHTKASHFLPEDALGGLEALVGSQVTRVSFVNSGKRSTTVHEHGEVVDSGSWEYGHGDSVIQGEDMFRVQMRSAAGLCGSLYFVGRNGTAYIVGVHIAGDSTPGSQSSLAVGMSQERYQAMRDAVDQFVKSQGDRFVPEGPEPSSGLEFVLTPSRHEAHGVDCAYTTSVPSHLPIGSKIKPTPFANVIVPTMAPAIVSEEALALSLTKLKVIRPTAPPPPLDQAISAFVSQHLVEGCRTWTVDQAVRSLVLSTSKGYPWAQVKGPQNLPGSDSAKRSEIRVDDDRIWMSTRIELALTERIERAKAGERTLTLWTGALKDEKRELDRVAAKKTRYISTCELTLLIMSRMLLGDMVEKIKSRHLHTPSAIGCNPHGDYWGSLAAYIAQFEHVVATDASNFDASIPSHIWDGITQIIERLYEGDGEEWRIARRVLLEEFRNAHHVIGDSVFVVQSSFPSGAFPTSLIDVMANYLANYTSLSRFTDDFAFRVYGDDIIICHNGNVDWAEHAKFMLEAHGMKITDAHKRDHIEDGSLWCDQPNPITFLGRSFDNRFGGVRAPLSLERVMEIPLWARDLGPNTMRSTLASFALELWHHGPAVYAEKTALVGAEPYFKTLSFRFPPYEAMSALRREADADSVFTPEAVEAYFAHRPARKGTYVSQGGDGPKRETARAQQEWGVPANRFGLGKRDRQRNKVRRPGHKLYDGPDTYPARDSRRPETTYVAQSDQPVALAVASEVAQQTAKDAPTVTTITAPGMRTASNSMASVAIPQLTNYRMLHSDVGVTMGPAGPIAMVHFGELWQLFPVRRAGQFYKWYSWDAVEVEVETSVPLGCYCVFMLHEDPDGTKVYSGATSASCNNNTCWHGGVGKGGRIVVPWRYPFPMLTTDANHEVETNVRLITVTPMHSALAAPGATVSCHIRVYVTVHGLRFYGQKPMGYFVAQGRNAAAVAHQLHANEKEGPHSGDSGDEATGQVAAAPSQSWSTTLARFATTAASYGEHVLSLVKGVGSTVGEVAGLLALAGLDKPIDTRAPEPTAPDTNLNHGGGTGPLRVNTLTLQQAPKLPCDYRMFGDDKDYMDVRELAAIPCVIGVWDITSGPWPVSALPWYTTDAGFYAREVNGETYNFPWCQHGFVGALCAGFSFVAAELEDTIMVSCSSMQHGSLRVTYLAGVSTLEAPALASLPNFDNAPHIIIDVNGPTNFSYVVPRTTNQMMDVIPVMPGLGAWHNTSTPNYPQESQQPGGVILITVERGFAGPALGVGASPLPIHLVLWRRARQVAFAQPRTHNAARDAAELDAVFAAVGGESEERRVVGAIRASTRPIAFKAQGPPATPVSKFPLDGEFCAPVGILSGDTTTTLREYMKPFVRVGTLSVNPAAASTYPTRANITINLPSGPTTANSPIVVTPLPSEAIPTTGITHTVPNTGAGIPAYWYHVSSPYDFVSQFFTFARVQNILRLQPRGATAGPQANRTIANVSLATTTDPRTVVWETFPPYAMYASASTVIYDSEGEVPLTVQVPRNAVNFFDVIRGPTTVPTQPVYSGISLDLAGSGAASMATFVAPSDDSTFGHPTAPWPFFGYQVASGEPV